MHTTDAGTRPESRYVLDMRVDATTYNDISRQILDWAHAGQGRAVFCATVHMVMEAFDHPVFRRQVNSADVVTTDGMPLVWALRRLGVAGARRVYGPDLTCLLLAAASREQLRVGFLGGTHRAELSLQPFTFRHIAEPDETAEISGHFHPKAQLAGQSRPCFLADAARLIMPAYGVYTGGLRSHDPALTALMAKDALAILIGPRVLAIPMPR